ncbi:MAG: hypothetical protein LBQ24_02325 [Candidatus Peribacteria bacterium]|nr:hypothetical protein [Candidatus Peribacteria bacterium]
MPYGLRHRFNCSYSSHLNFHIRENPHQNLTDFDLVRVEGKKLKKINNKYDMVVVTKLLKYVPKRHKV